MTGRLVNLRSRAPGGNQLRAGIQLIGNADLTTYGAELRAVTGFALVHRSTGGSETLTAKLSTEETLPEVCLCQCGAGGRLELCSVGSQGSAFDRLCASAELVVARSFAPWVRKTE